MENDTGIYDKIADSGIGGQLLLKAADMATQHGYGRSRRRVGRPRKSGGRKRKITVTIHK